MGFFKDIMSFVKMDDDGMEEAYDDYVKSDDFDDDDSEYNDEAAEPKKRSLFGGSTKKSSAVYEEAAAEKTSYAKPLATSRSASDDYYPQSVSEPKKVQKSQPSATKVVPIRNTSHGFEVKVRKPTCFEDSQEICDIILSGCAAIVNLEGFDVELAQRVMDFISGSIYAVNGNLHQISNYIFIVSPDNVDISGDYFDLLRENGFGVPTLTKGF